MARWQLHFSAIPPVWRWMRQEMFTLLITRITPFASYQPMALFRPSRENWALLQAPTALEQMLRSTILPALPSHRMARFTSPTLETTPFVPSPQMLSLPRLPDSPVKPGPQTPPETWRASVRRLELRLMTQE